MDENNISRTARLEREAAEKWEKAYRAWKANGEPWKPDMKAAEQALAKAHIAARRARLDYQIRAAAEMPPVDPRPFLKEDTP